MNRRTRYTAAIALTIVGFAGSSVAQTDSTFIYQGELKDNGAVANGSFDMDFSLWDAANVGGQIGATESRVGIIVVEGRFAIDLDFGAAAFDNSDRWLQVDVEGQPLSPRQPITRTPYAIQTRGIYVDHLGRVGIGTSLPGQQLQVQTDTRARAVFGHNLATSGFKVGVYGQNDSTAGAGVFGRSTSTSGFCWGLIGQSDSSDGRGVVGSASSTNGVTTGVYGASSSDEGTGVYGIASSTSGVNIGVHGTTNSPNGYAGYFTGGRNFFDGNVGIGTLTSDYTLHVESIAERVIFGHSTATSGTKNGVYGRIESTSGSGVFGFASATSGIVFGVRGESRSAIGQGVAGLASALSGANFGVRGQSFSDEGTGVLGAAYNDSGTNYGIWGQSDSTTGFDFYAGGAGIDYGSSSSIRWKRNIERIDDPLYKLSKLRGVYFDWDEEHGGHRDVGLIAEEIGAVLPEIVNYEENGIDAHGMDYSRMSALLVEAVNELHGRLVEENAALRAEHEIMADRLAALEHRLVDMEAKAMEPES